jgi:flap endonuclease-1
MNYLSLDIELLFVFDGKPPENKQSCIQERKKKSLQAKESIETAKDEAEKLKLERLSMRVTPEMINDIKKLLGLLGVSYIHPEVGEGEAYASELCRMGFVDYVLTEDMDTMAYGCPKLIRRCVDKSFKRKDIISVFDYEKVIQGINLSHDKFIDFCILCGCDYCETVEKVGNTTALKLIRKYPSIEEIVSSTNYQFPENYLKMFHCAKENFLLYYDKLKIDDMKIYTSEKNIPELETYLIQEIGMNQKRVWTTLKKLNNVYKVTH